jgi:hypothetical protein
MDICVDACHTAATTEEQRRLASAAYLFAQVAEHLQRGNPLTSQLITRCSHAISRLRDERVRGKVEAQLSVVSQATLKSIESG